MPESTIRTTCKDESAIADPELIQSALAGHQRSYELLMQRYQDRLFRSMCNVVGSETLAEDIVQEAFVRAFMNLESFRCQCNFYTWLYRIALNARRPYFRDRTSQVSMDTVGDHAISDKRDTPDVRIERSEECKQVRHALSRLDAHHRAILVLREFDGLDYESIAQILRINKGTVRSRLSRARARLKKELTRYVNVEAAGQIDRQDSRLACSD